MKRFLGLALLAALLLAVPASHILAGGKQGKANRCHAAQCDENNPETCVDINVNTHSNFGHSSHASGTDGPVGQTCAESATGDNGCIEASCG